MNKVEEFLQKHPDLQDYQNNLEMQLLMLDNPEDRVVLLANKIAENLEQLQKTLDELLELLDASN